MQALNPAVIKINNTNVNVMTVDTGLYPDVGIATSWLTTTSVTHLLKAPHSRPA